MNEFAGDRLRAIRRADSETKAARVRAALDKMVTRAALDKMVTGATVIYVSEVARTAGVSRRFLYSHPELLAAIHAAAAQSATRFACSLERSAQVSAQSLRAELEAVKATNRRLRQEISILEARVSEVLGTEVAQELANRGVLTPRDELQTELEGLGRRVLELEDMVRLRDEELAAARTLNRNLIAEMNRKES